ncbi:MAG: thiamine pyrophosphate-binding protein [Gammaproteobacteria bacterium]|nr:thiamine pyrophosphate-binding protein [Gammaproteobacteria bacterium]
MNGGDHVGQMLQAQGVEFLFTLCGGHISPILKGAKDRGIRIVDVRHEATAVFAADAVARLTGIPGVAAVTAGPGVTNTITAVKNAQLAQSPVVLIGGATATALKGRGALQDIDQMALFRPHVKWAHSAKTVRDLGPTLQRAFQMARSGVPGPVFVECPVDLLYDEATVREWYAASTPRGKSLPDRVLRAWLNRHTNKIFSGAQNNDQAPVQLVIPPLPAPHKVSRAVSRIAKSQRPVLVVGSQALVEAAQAEAVAAAIERIGMPVYLSGMARGLLGPAHELHRRHQRRKALREADLVLLAGVPCDFRLDYGRQIGREARLISVNRSRRDLRQNKRPDIAIHGDAGLFLQSLGDALGDTTQQNWTAWKQKLRERDDERETQIDADAARPGEYVNPIALCRTIDAELPDRSVIVADGGDFVGTASYIVRPRGPLRWLDPGAFGTLGCGAGFALGAALCRPGDEIWALFGDGSVGYALAEFDTFVRHAIPVIAVVGNDASWAQIAREQVKMLGDDVGTVLMRSDYHEAAAALGGKAVLLQHANQTALRLQEAQHFARNGAPVLVNAWLDRTDFREGSLSM